MYTYQLEIPLPKMFKLLVVLAVLGVVLAAPNQRFINTPNITTFNNVGIVGGHTADISNHPWTVSVQYLYQHFCGGILISSNWVITAAHCLDAYNTNLNIRAGSNQRASGGQAALVNGYVIHPSYGEISLDNDIALLRLATAITNANARAATLPRAGAVVADGSLLYITGWGAIREDGPGSASLLEVSVPTINRQQCARTYASIRIVTGNMVCAGLSAGGRDSCQGDSGGPASIDGVVVGVVSWGAGCARAGLPGVYAKIANYRAWMAQYTGF